MTTRTAAGLPPLPTLFRPEALREGRDAMAEATARAAAAGAGALFWVRSLARAEAAVVLEPEQPLRAARPAWLAASAALMDALAALGPPEIPVGLRWPGTVLVNGAEAARVRLRLPPGTAEDAVPEWLVVGFEARFAVLPGIEPGAMAGMTTLEGEGFETEPAELVAAWARHLMAVLSEWQARGHRRLADRILPRLEREAWMGQGKRGLDPVGFDLVLDDAGARRVVALRDAA